MLLIGDLPGGREVMRGQVLSYDQLAGEGLISGEDGGRYSFRGSEWKGSTTELRAGRAVDFQGDSSAALSVYPIAAPVAPGFGADEKSYLVAGLLALFLGTLGVHKFYMGYQKEGIILLATTVVSWMLLIVIIGFFGLMATGIIAFVEAIIYLTSGQEKFQQVYIEGHKSWF